MRYAKITYPDINNGPGCRVSIFIQGCSIQCKNCFNKELWNFNGGINFSKKDFANLVKILNKPYISGLSILGGEPTDSTYKGLLDLCIKIKKLFPNKTIWLYSGRTYKQIKDSFPKLLNYIDVLVDGQFVEEKKNTSLAFRGSENQDIIDVKNLKILNNFYDDISST